MVPLSQSLRRGLLRRRPEEIALVALALCLAILIVAARHVPPLGEAPAWRLARRFDLYLVGCVAVVAVFTRNWRGVLRDFAPFYGVAVMYEALHDLTPVIRVGVADAALVAIDRAVLHVDAAAWLGQYGTPLLSWLLAICHGSTFVVPPALAAAIYLAGENRLFRDFMLAGVIAMALGFVGFMLVPAVGPYAFQAELFPTRLPGGGYCPRFIGSVGDFRGLARDAFPSMHVAQMTVASVFAFRFRRVVFAVVLPVAVGVATSAIYLRMHYFVDVVAGGVLAVIAILAAPALNRMWSRPQLDVVASA